MSRFRFRLERVARLRTHEEQAAKLAWAEADTAAREARERVRALLEERTRADDHQARQRSHGTIDVSMELANTAVRDLLDAKVRNAMSEQQRLEQEAERLRDVYAERKKDREALTRLEELAHERYRKEVEASEQAEADESASMRHARRDRA